MKPILFLLPASIVGIVGIAALVLMQIEPIQTTPLIVDSIEMQELKTKLAILEKAEAEKLATSNTMVEKTRDGVGMAQMSGTLSTSLEAGETKILYWQIGSYYNESVELVLSASGEGSQYITIDTPKITTNNELKSVEIIISLPLDFNESVTFEPRLHALMQVSDEGNAKMNLEAVKQVIIEAGYA